MNKKHLIWAIAHGMIFGLLMLNGISPREESFDISPGPEVDYHGVIEKDDFRAEIRRNGNGSLNVSFEPQKNFYHYTWAALFALLMGLQHYGNLKNEAKSNEEDEDGCSLSSNHPQNEDPLYEEFLQEDANRRLFPRRHLEEEFQAWVSTRRFIRPFTVRWSVGGRLAAIGLRF